MGGGGGGPLTKNFFPSLNMYQANSGVKNFSLYWGAGGSLLKKIFPVWTCIKPNLVSKIFPFTETGYPPKKSETWDPPTPKNLRPGTTPWKSETWDPPQKNLRPGTPPKNLRPGTPLPRKSETWDPPHLDLDLGTPAPESVDRYTDRCQNITFPRTTYAGGKNVTNGYPGAIDWATRWSVKSSICGVGGGVKWAFLRDLVKWVHILHPPTKVS